MKSVFICIFLCFNFFYSTSGQVNYSFSATSAPYVPVANGTTPPLINRPYGNNQYSFTYDEGFANNVPIGFTFSFNGYDYT